MKKLSFIVLLSIILSNTYAQSYFDRSMNDLTHRLSNKLNQKGVNRLVVLFVKEINRTDINKTDREKANTVLGKTIADNLSYNLINSENNFQVLNRDYLFGVTEAKVLIEDGIIDPDNTKKLGQILSVDVILIGNYTVISDSIKVIINALDVITGFTTASVLKNFYVDDEIASLLGIRGKNVAEGYNSPVKSNENINNPLTVDAECESKNLGDYCFTNNTSKRFKVLLYIESKDQGYGPKVYVEHERGFGSLGVEWSGGDVTIEPGETECFYNLKAQPMIADIRQITTDSASYRNRVLRKSNIRVEKCTSKTYIIQ